MRTMLVAAAVLAFVALGTTPAASKPRPIDPAIHKIRHIVVIMQENRSFDSYFGTYPGADGIPMRNGRPTVSLPNPMTGTCMRPFHDTSLVNVGGLHGAYEAERDIDGGKMDGFITQALGNAGNEGCTYYPSRPCRLDPQHPDLIGYHTAAEIPNYWAYAK